MTASVIITTKNRREELLKAVKSAMAQRGLLEVIVIDDGSTDGTAEEVERIIAEKGWLIADSGCSFAAEERLEPTIIQIDTDKSKDAGPCLDKPSGAVFSNPSRLTLRADLRSLHLAPAPVLDCGEKNSGAPEALSLDPRRSTLDPQSATKPQLRLIRHEVSAGYIFRRNEGARVARGDVIFSLDDDAVFSSPFVVEQTLRDFSHPRIGALAIPYIEPHKANREMQRAPTQEDVWITASYIGTAHAVRRDVFLALGGYREHLVHQGEEGDFCLRMLAAELEEKAESGNAEKLKTDLTTEDTTERLGGREMEQPKVGPKGEGVGTTESKSTEGEAGLTTDDADIHGFQKNQQGGAQGTCAGASESDSLPSELADSPGFFVRLGNSDPIIHNESPKRDYSRMDFYGRRNDVLFHWQNTPMPDLLWQLPKTIAGGLVCAAKVGRWRKMLEGIGVGFVAIAGGVQRKPVSKSVLGFHKKLKHSPHKF